MRSYELMLLIRPTLDEQAAAQVAQKVVEQIHSHNGEVAAVDVWGRRKLAYPIDNQLEGTYILLKPTVEPTVLKDIEFNLKLDEDILRYMLVKDLSSAAVEASAVEPEEAVFEETDEEETEDEDFSEAETVSAEDESDEESTSEALAA
jgi:small subunit ribosomal protein S6